MVYCDTDKEIAQKICVEAAYDNPFPPNLFEDYANRLETPNPAKRWDKPLFHLRADEDIPFDQITQACLEGEKPRDPVSTKPVSQSLIQPANIDRCRRNCSMLTLSSNSIRRVKK